MDSSDQPNDSFLFVSVSHKTAKDKAPTRNPTSRSHVMRFVRRRDKIDQTGKWSGKVEDEVVAPSSSTRRPETKKQAPKVVLAARKKATVTNRMSEPRPMTPISPFQTPEKDDPEVGKSCTRDQDMQNWFLDYDSYVTPQQMAFRTKSPMAGSSRGLATPSASGEDEEPEESGLTNAVMALSRPHDQAWVMPWCGGFRKKGCPDPLSFINMPIEEKSWQKVLHYYTTTLFVSAYCLSNPQQGTSDLFRLAISDETVMSSIILISMANGLICFASPNFRTDKAIAKAGQPQPEEYQPKKFKAKAIRLLHQRMSDIVASTSDSTILTIYKVATAELFLGNVEEAKIHHQGVCRIVELRGGLENIPPMLAQGCLMIESVSPGFTPALRRPLIFDQIAHRSLSEIAGQHGVTLPKHEIQAYDPIIECFTPEFQAILRRIQDLMLYAEVYGLHPQDDPTLSKIAQTYQLKYFVVKHQLVCYQAVTPLEEVFRTAVWAFLNMTYMRANPACTPIRLQVQDLLRQLNDQLTANLLKLRPGLLLWLSTIGAFCTLGQDEHEQFLALLKRASTQLDFSTWLQCRQELTKYLFYKGPMEYLFQNMWFDAYMSPVLT